MDLRRWTPRIFTLAVPVLVVAMLANNASLADDPVPATSWGPATVTDGQTVMLVTFQTEPGDRLAIDLGGALFNLHVPLTVAGASAQLYSTPPGEAGPATAQLVPVESYEGDFVNEPPRGLFFRPEPPVWTVRGDSWWSLVVTVDHGDYRPPTGTGRAAYAGEMGDRLAGRGTGSISWSPYETVPARALNAQPWFYAVEGLAFTAILASAIVMARTTRSEADGLAGALQLAVRARTWLASLHQLLWIVAIALAGIAVLVGMLLAGIGLGLRPALEPDAFYIRWMVGSLLTALALSAIAVAVLLLRVRRASRSIPDLDLDA